MKFTTSQRMSYSDVQIVCIKEYLVYFEKKKPNEIK